MNKKTPQNPVKDGDYRIVQYPDKSSKTGRVYFVDKRVKKYFLGFIPYRVWETVRWESGDSIHWFDFNQCVKDIEYLKKGLKIYR